MNFNFKYFKIPDITLVTSKVFNDSRGFFGEVYKCSEFASAGITELFVQSNRSQSIQGVLRGLHYQLNPYAQGKLVRCVKGAIWDVGVDIRIDSSTYGQWIGINLNEVDNNALYIPPGFAHGFYTITDIAEIQYSCTDEYSQEHDRGIIWNDPNINIKWPSNNPLLSDKDSKHPTLNDADNNFYLHEIKHSKSSFLIRYENSYNRSERTVSTIFSELTVYFTTYIN